MLTASSAAVFGLVLLVWSADRLVAGSAATARHFGMPPLLIGMVIIGFGTSAPEMVVSAISALQGNPGIALGNAYGSNITNIALILGLTAFIRPIAVHSQALRKEIPILIFVTLLSVLLLRDLQLSRKDALILLIVFSGLMAWTIVEGLRQRNDVLAREFETELKLKDMPMGWALFWLFTGLVLLIVSSRLLVWGAVEIARGFKISDLVIGLTIVAVGTSLPELASSIIATRKGEHDIALGNVLGSNLFNTLAVVGIAGAIHPMVVAPEVLYRDMAVMGALTISLFAICSGFRGPSRISRWEGALLLVCYIGYNLLLIYSILYQDR